MSAYKRGPLVEVRLYIECACYYNTILTEWIKGIYHMWSRGRRFSPSLPGDRYLKLGSEIKRSPAEISGNIFRYDALHGATSRDTALRFLFLCLFSALGTFLCNRFQNLVLHWLPALKMDKVFIWLEFKDDGWPVLSHVTYSCWETKHELLAHCCLENHSNLGIAKNCKLFALTYPGFSF